MRRIEQTLKNSKQWKSAIIPQKVHPYRTKPLHSVHPNVIEDDKGKEPTNFQHKLHISPSGTSIIPPEVPVPPPRVQTAQPPRVDKEGPSSNLRSIGKKKTLPLYALTSQFQKTHETNAATHQIFGVVQEYRHLIKVPERKNLVNILCKRIGTVSLRCLRGKGYRYIHFHYQS